MKTLKPFRAISILLWIFVSAVSGYAFSAESPNDIVIIVNRNFKEDKLSVADIRRMFRKEITMWKGASVKPIHAPSGSALRNGFINRILQMDEAAEQKYWQDMKVRKGMSPPFELSNTVRAVFSAPGAISYCFRRDFNPAVAKILHVF